MSMNLPQGVNARSGCGEDVIQDIASALRVDSKTQQFGRGLTISFEKSRKAQLKNKEDKMRHRQRCGCNAAADQFSLSENHLDQHHLFANCTSCGLIICAKEGEGVCFYCNAYVTACGTNFDDADGEHVNTGLQLANDHKDKLLSFASSSAKRTSIIDDQGDFFDLFGSMDDAWLDPQDRDQRIRKAQQEEIKNNMPRSSAPLTFSLLPVTKSNSANSFGVSSSTITMQSQSGSRTVIQSSNSKQSKSSASYFTNDTLTGSAHRVYSALLARRPISTIRPQLHVEKQKNQLLSALTPESSADDKPSGGVKPIPEDPDKSKSQAFDLAAIARIEKEWRTQDSKFVNFRQVPFASTSNFDSESRMCLSMHQPWASLLVAGIKRLEGRSWFSSYRGILWIHAAAHEASSEEIESLTSMYRSLYKTDAIPFPTKYPVSAIVGCVEIVDFLSHDQLSRTIFEEKARHHDVNLLNYTEDNDSPFVFVCRNPLRVRLPIKCNGQHKIWELPDKVHSVAKNSLVPVDQDWWLQAVHNLLCSSNDSNFWD